MFTDAANGTLMPLVDVLDAAGVMLPESVLGELNVLRYTAFVVDEPEKELNRFGFVVETTDATDTTGDLQAWEATMLADSMELFTTLGYVSDIGMPNPFESFERGEVLIRYANLPDASLALDYAVDRELGYFYFATSRESMTAALNAR
jgi:hypothetical protein